MYFHELPNPLCTYKLYQSFIDAIQYNQMGDCKLIHIQSTVQKLPLPHYRYFVLFATFDISY
jgi:hypothetical protein